MPTYSRSDLERWGISPEEYERTMTFLGRDDFKLGQAVDRAQDPQAEDAAVGATVSILPEAPDRNKELNRISAARSEQVIAGNDPVAAFVPDSIDALIDSPRVRQRPGLQDPSALTSRQESAVESTGTPAPQQQLTPSESATPGETSAFFDPMTLPVRERVRQRLQGLLNPEDYQELYRKGKRQVGLSLIPMKDPITKLGVKAAQNELESERAKALNRVASDEDVADIYAEELMRFAESQDWMLPAERRPNLTKDQIREYVLRPENGGMLDDLRVLSLMDGLKAAKMNGGGSFRRMAEDILLSAGKGLMQSHLDLADSFASVTGSESMFEKNTEARRQFGVVDEATPYADHSTIGGWVVDAAGLAAPMVESLAVDAALSTATGGGWLLGKAATKVAARLPGWTARAARVARTSPYWFARAQGSSYRDMIDRGVSREIALPVSALTAWASSKIESSQRTNYGRLSRTKMSQVVSKIAKETEGLWLARYAAGAVQEGAQEFVQQGIEELGKNLGAITENALTDAGVQVTTAREIGKTMVEAFGQTVGPSLILGLPGAGVEGVKAIQDKRQEPIRRANWEAFIRMQQGAQDRAGQAYRDMADMAKSVQQAQEEAATQREMESQTERMRARDVPLTSVQRKDHFSFLNTVLKNMEEGSEGDTPFARSLRNALSLVPMDESREKLTPSERMAHEQAVSDILTGFMERNRREFETRGLRLPAGTKAPPPMVAVRDPEGVRARPGESLEQAVAQSIGPEGDPRAQNWRKAWANSTEPESRKIASDPLNELSDEELNWIAYSEAGTEQGDIADAILELRELGPDEIPARIGDLSAPPDTRSQALARARQRAVGRKDRLRPKRGRGSRKNAESTPLPYGNKETGTVRDLAQPAQQEAPKPKKTPAEIKATPKAERKALTEAYKKTAEDMNARVSGRRGNLVEAVQEQFGYSKTDAETIIAEYEARKVLKIDPVDGSSKLQDGRLWEKSSMDRALELARDRDEKPSTKPKKTPAEIKAEKKPKKPRKGRLSPNIQSGRRVSTKDTNLPGMKIASFEFKDVDGTTRTTEVAFNTDGGKILTQAELKEIALDKVEREAAREKARALSARPPEANAVAPKTGTYSIPRDAAGEDILKNVGTLRTWTRRSMTQADIDMTRDYALRLKNRVEAVVEEWRKRGLKKDGNRKANIGSNTKFRLSEAEFKLDKVNRLLKLIDEREQLIREGKEKPLVSKKKKKPIDWGADDWRDAYVEENNLDLTKDEDVQKLAEHEMEVLESILSSPTPEGLFIGYTLVQDNRGNALGAVNTTGNNWDHHVHFNSPRVKVMEHTRPDGVRIEGLYEVEKGTSVPDRIKASDPVWSTYDPEGTPLAVNVTRDEANRAAIAYHEESKKLEEEMGTPEEIRQVNLDAAIERVLKRLNDRVSDSFFANPNLAAHLADLIHLGALYIKKGFVTFPKWRTQMMKLPVKAWRGVNGGLASVWAAAGRAIRRGADNPVNRARRWLFTPWGILSRKTAALIEDSKGSDFGLRDWIRRFDRGQELGVDPVHSEDVEAMTADYVLRAATQISKLSKQDAATLLSDMRKGNLKTKHHKALRLIFDAMGQLGVARGWFEEAIKNYVPRAYDPNAIMADYTGFVDTIAEHMAIHDAGGESAWYKMAPSEQREAFADAVESAKAIADNIIHGQSGASRDYFAEHNVRGAKRPSPLRHRTLDFIPDEVLDPWLYSDPRYGMLLAMRQTIDYGEWRNRMKDFPAIIGRMREARVDPALIEQTVRLAKVISGVYMQSTDPASSFGDRKFMTGLRAMASMSLMGMVTLASITEFGLPIARAATNNQVANVKHGVMGVLGASLAVIEKGVEKITQIITRDPDFAMTKSETRMMSKEIGVFVRGYLQDLVMNRDMGDLIPGSKADNILRVYYKVTGLEYLTRVQRIMATATAMSFINHSLRRLSSRKPGSRGYNRHLELMQELGLNEETQQELIAWHNAGAKRTGKGFDIYKRMVLRFVSETIMDPKREDKSMAANSRNPFVQALTHLQGFNQAARNKIAPRIAEQARRGNLGPLLALSIPLTFAAGTLILRSLMKGEDPVPDDEKEWLKFGVDMVARSGPLGTLTAPYDIAQSLVWGRDPANITAGAFYSVIGDIAKASAEQGLAIAAMAIGETDEAKKRGRSAVKKNVKLIPVVRQLPQVQEAVSDAVIEAMGIKETKAVGGSRSKRRTFGGSARRGGSGRSFK